MTLARLNDALQGLWAKVPANCKPNFIDEKQVSSDEKLKQTANQMWWLSHCIPLALGEFIPENDEKWLNFIRLTQMQQLCTSPVATHATSACLEILVARHNAKYQQLYPDASYPPKLHYLVHLPNQIRTFGPARNQWCMRMEAKNSFFKRKKLKNTKNVPKSVAKAHQQWICSMQHDNNAAICERFLTSPPINKPGKIKTIESYEFSHLFKQQAKFGNVSEVLCVPLTTVCGISYGVGNFLLHKWDSEVEFLRVNDIVVLFEDVNCICEVYTTVFFSPHYNSYVVQASANLVLVEPTKLKIPWPVYSYKPTGSRPNQFLISPMCLPDLSEMV